MFCLSLGLYEPFLIIFAEVVVAVVALLIYRWIRRASLAGTGVQRIAQNASRESTPRVPERERPAQEATVYRGSRRRPAAAPGVFVSYRRQDTPHLAGRLYDRLGEHFGQERVFMDVDSIEPGLDFGEVITGALSSCAVMLVLIGDQWLTIGDARGRRRLDNPDDYVRMELEAALTRNIRVIPMLAEGAVMPGSQELPDVLKGLARRNALEISHSRFSADADRVITTIERVLSAPSR
jgi:TIR domain